MDRHTLRPSEWTAINDMLKQIPGVWKSREDELRKFVSAVVWIARTGTAWADLPAHFGGFDAVRQRFCRWAKRGIWEKIFRAFRPKAVGKRPVFVDATICKVHRSGSGARGGGEEAIGRSRGGLTTKIHAATDENGRALELILTPGQSADCKQFLPLVETMVISAVVADRAYDSNEIRATMEERGVAVCIPTKRNRTVQIPHDVALYAKRHAVENFFLSLKDWCRVTTRRDKTTVIYMAFVHIASALVNKRKEILCS